MLLMPRLLALLAALPAAGADHHADGRTAEHTAAWAHRTYASSSLASRNVSFDAASNASGCRGALPPYECPVDDASYCDEFDWLDVDCSGGLGLAEFTESASFPELKSVAQVRAGRVPARACFSAPAPMHCLPCCICWCCSLLFQSRNGAAVRRG